MIIKKNGVHDITQLIGSLQYLLSLYSSLPGPKKINPLPLPVFKTGPHESFPPSNWLPTPAAPIPLVILGLLLCCVRSSCIWAEPWLFTAALSESAEWVHLTLIHMRAHTLTHSKTQKGTPLQRTLQYAHLWCPCSAFRPAGADADSSRCSTGVTIPLDTNQGGTESSDRAAGYCSNGRCVNWLTGNKRRERK